MPATEIYVALSARKGTLCEGFMPCHDGHMVLHTTWGILIIHQIDEPPKFQVPDVLKSSVMRDGVQHFPSDLIPHHEKIEQSIIFCRKLFVYHCYWLVTDIMFYLAPYKMDWTRKSNVMRNSPELPTHIGVYIIFGHRSVLSTSDNSANLEAVHWLTNFKWDWLGFISSILDCTGGVLKSWS